MKVKDIAPFIKFTDDVVLLQRVATAFGTNVVSEPVNEVEILTYGEYEVVQIQNGIQLYMEIKEA